MNLRALELKFRGDRSPRLVETLFTHPALGGEVLRCENRQPFGEQLRGTFLWSSGVRGVCELFVRHKLAGLLHSPDLGQISGHAGSEASILYWAVRNNERWVQDMFGLTLDLRPLGIMLLQDFTIKPVVNGSTVLRIDRDELPADAVRVRLNGMMLSSPGPLWRLLRALESPHDPVDNILYPENEFCARLASAA